MRWALLAWSAFLAGCGSPVDFLTGGRVEGDSEAVTVQADSAPQAAPMALSHCSHYGRGTQFDREVAARVFRYRCIEND
ncbi:hypothetical protein [Dongia deserti]|uniref:hypothetical protein n=1 Tax=Dongia deserti TaxID=2268030 RepID=UPI000E650501|nr:hypothetical protein [Dongia deserti]